MTISPAHLDEHEDESGYVDDDSHEREYDDDFDESSSDASDDSEQGPDSSEENPTVMALKNQIAELNRRYSGQTRKVDELMQAGQMREQQYRQERRQVLEAIVRERTIDLPREEQEEKIRLLHTRLDDEERHLALSNREQMVGEGLREHYFQNLANQYGVDVNTLRNFRDVADAEFFAAREAQRLRQEEQTKKRDGRRSKKSDSFDAPRNTSAPPKTPKNMDEAENAFLRLARRSR